MSAFALLIRPLDPDGAVASLMVIDAADLDAALARVHGFPGLAWGTAVEVRAVEFRTGVTP